MKPTPIITTNHNVREIEVESEYDEKQNIIRIDIKLRKQNEK